MSFLIQWAPSYVIRLYDQTRTSGWLACCLWSSGAFALWYGAYAPLEQYRHHLAQTIQQSQQQRITAQNLKKRVPSIHKKLQLQQQQFLQKVHAWNKKTTQPIVLDLISRASSCGLQVLSYTPVSGPGLSKNWLQNTAYTLNVEGTQEQVQTWISRCRALSAGLHIQSLHVRSGERKISSTITWMVSMIKIPST